MVRVQLFHVAARQPALLPEGLRVIWYSKQGLVERQRPFGARKPIAEQIAGVVAFVEVVSLVQEDPVRANACACMWDVGGGGGEGDGLIV
eukprot:SAG11_NODE_758_length_7313_cov_10.164818_2_plen_90_part_00